MIEIGIPCEASSEFALDTAFDAIAAAMLWPKEAGYRSKFVLDRYLFRTQGLPLDFSLAAYSNQISKGLVAGFVLRNAVAKLILGEVFKLSDFKSLFCELSLFQYSSKTVDNDVWPTFKGVSPLWAAHITLVEIGLIKQDTFPSSKESISEFVGTAECFKKAGQKRTPRSRERSLLRENEGYILTKAVVDALPPFAAEAYSLDFVKT